jgi:cytochrome P450
MVLYLPSKIAIMPITYKDLKGPKGLPVVGSLFKIELNNMHNQLEGWAKEYGKVYKLILGPSKLTVITDPEMILEVLRERPHTYRRMAKMDEIMKEDGVKGVFNAEGEEWKAHRRLVTKGLDVKHQQHFFPEILVSLERLHNKWNKAAQSKTVFDIQQDLLRFTVDVTTSLAFGYKTNTLEEEGDVIQQHLEKIFPMIFARINAPIPLWRYFKTKKDKEFDHAVVEINKFIDELLIVGKERLKNNPELREKPETFIESLIIAAEDEDTLTDEDVKGNLLTILMAGEDTTAHSLAWCIYLLAERPDIQEKLYEEAVSVFDGDYIKEYQKHGSLPYTEAVAMESMRIKPVAPLMLYEPLMDTELHGYSFKAGSRLLLETRYANMQDEYFAKANEFDPERWVDPPKGKCPMGHDTRGFIPFGSGPRFCPGKNLAMLEMKLVLSMLMKNFKVQLSTPKEDVKEVMAFTMMPTGFLVKLVRR